MRQLVPVVIVISSLSLSVGCEPAAAPMTDAAVVEWPPLPECRMAYEGAPLRDHEVVRGTAPGVSFALWRCYADQAAGRSALYRADRFELAFEGRTYRATTLAIDYTNTHHNWADSLVAVPSGPGAPEVTLRWRVVFDSTVGLRHYVSASAAGGTVLLPETETDVLP
ncbi:MAG: hypothetical protein K8H88_01540 [Sandaracinaceae bacterium]|nr:hypothetical protein [Sandaracinaceae bacterium]